MRCRNNSRLVSEHTKKIGIFEKLSYGCGDMGGNFLWTGISAFLIYFYTNVAGMSAVLIGTIMLASRIFDGFSDMIMGIIVDKTNTRFGKARPWILRMAIPFGITCVLLFTVPNFGELGNIFYVIITYNLATSIVYTSIDIPYGVLNSLITQDQYQRSLLNIFRMIMGIFGSLIVAVAVMPLTEAFGGGAGGWQKTFIIFGIAGTITYMMVFFFTKERVKPAVIQKEKIPAKIGLRALMKNKYWFIVTIVSIACFLVQGFGSVSVYFAQYIMGSADLYSLLAITLTIPMLIGFILMTPFVKKYGKRNVAIIGLIVSIIGLIITAINPYDLIIVIVGNILKGLGMASIAGTVFALVADTIEYGEWKTGLRTEGIIYSATSFGMKMGIGLGTAFVGWILAWANYDASAAVQSTLTTSSIIAMVTYIPIGLMVIQIIFLLFYKLDKEYPKILEELRNRNNQQTNTITEGKNEIV